MFSSEEPECRLCAAAVAHFQCLACAQGGAGGAVVDVVVVVVPYLVCPCKPTPLRKSKPLAGECHRSSGLLMLCSALMCMSAGQWVTICVRLWVLVLE